MVEKNILMTTKDKNGQTVIIRPYTSMYNVEGLQEYISKKFAQFLIKIKGIFVMQEEGKELSTNDFSNYYKDKLDNLAVKNVTQVSVNGQTIETIDGTVEITTEAVIDTASDNDIEEIFNKII